MTSSHRKLVGTIILVIVVPVYALLAMAVAIVLLPSLPFVWQLAYYVVAGLIWVLPAGGLVTWMARPDR